METQNNGSIGNMKADVSKLYTHLFSLFTLQN